MSSSREPSLDADAATPKSAAFTPGPWAWGPGFEFGDSSGDLFGSGGRKVLASASYENMWLAAYDKATDAANARLIAAAPELLEALRFIKNYVQTVRAPSPATVLELCDAAIAKATGAPQ